MEISHIIIQEKKNSSHNLFSRKLFIKGRSLLFSLIVYSLVHILDKRVPHNSIYFVVYIKYTSRQYEKTRDLYLPYYIRNCQL
jgi:hypothetical protein